MNRRNETGEKPRGRHLRIFDRTRMRHRLRSQRGISTDVELPEPSVETSVETPVAEAALPAATKPRKPRAVRKPDSQTSASAADEPTATEAAPDAEPVDPWSKERGLAADRISLMTTAECLRLYRNGVHPSTIVFEIEPCAEIADFQTIFAGDVKFVMGARTRQESAGTSARSVAMVTGVIGPNGHVGIYAIDQCHWDKGDRHNLPVLVPLAETTTRARQNPYAMSVSIEGLSGVQLERTDITLRDVVDGFMLAHRGLTHQELSRRYTYAMAGRIGAIMSIIGAHTPLEEGRMLDWPGWANVPVDRERKRDREDGRSIESVHSRHAEGRYGNGQRLAPEDEYLGLEVNDKAETRETLYLLRQALTSVNLPSDAEQYVLQAIETLTVERGATYANDQ